MGILKRRQSAPDGWLNLDRLVEFGSSTIGFPTRLQHTSGKDWLQQFWVLRKKGTNGTSMMEPKQDKRRNSFSTGLLKKYMSKSSSSTEKLQRNNGPEFTVLNKTDEYEERVYRESTWASVTICSLYQDTAKTEGFRHLLSYVMGENEAGATLTMSPPIVTKISSNGGSNFERKFVVSTYLSDKQVSQLPQPNSDDVCLERVPETTVFVKSFQGLTSDELWAFEAKKLAELLRNKEAIRTDHYITASYDSPFQLVSDMNEIWLVKYDPVKDEKIKQRRHNSVQIGSDTFQFPQIVSRVLHAILFCLSIFVYIGTTVKDVTVFVFTRWRLVLQHMWTVLTWIRVCLGVVWASPVTITISVYTRLKSMVQQTLAVLKWVVPSQGFLPVAPATLGLAFPSLSDFLLSKLSQVWDRERL